MLVGNPRILRILAFRRAPPGCSACEQDPFRGKTEPTAGTPDAPTDAMPPAPAPPTAAPQPNRGAATEYVEAATSFLQNRLLVPVLEPKTALGGVGSQEGLYSQTLRRAKRGAREAAIWHRRKHRLNDKSPNQLVQLTQITKSPLFSRGPNHQIKIMRLGVYLALRSPRGHDHLLSTIGGGLNPPR